MTECRDEARVLDISCATLLLPLPPPLPELSDSDSIPSGTRDLDILLCFRKLCLLRGFLTLSPDMDSDTDGRSIRVRFRGRSFSGSWGRFRRLICRGSNRSWGGAEDS